MAQIALVDIHIVYTINAANCNKFIQNKSIQNRQIYILAHMHPLPEYG